jgi:xanthine dehydrogenase YagR molybdenum-binding subunit
VFGIGMPLMKESAINAASGRVVNGSIAASRMPVNADIPDIQTILVDCNDTTTTPLAIKGISELPAERVVAAIAIHHATGMSVRQLSIRCDDLLI